MSFLFIYYLIFVIYIMQFPVPQFTDVEDKIIGPLSLKQFGILFGVGMVVFLGYSATKSLLVAVFLFVALGVPALVLALVPFNGRPMYNFIGKLFKFLIGPKELVFHKEVYGLNSDHKLNDVQISAKLENQPQQNPQAHLREVQALLQKTADEERDVAERIK